MTDRPCCARETKSDHALRRLARCIAWNPVLEPPGSSLILGQLSFNDQDSIEPCGRRQETLRAGLIGLWGEVAQTRRGRGWSK